MNSRPNKCIFFFFLINFLFAFSTILWSQDSSINKSCMPPSEQELVVLLQEITSRTQFQGLQIGGLITGAFTKKGQLDCVLWLKEQTKTKKTVQRQIIKLICQNATWKIAFMGKLPSGITLAKKNFVDVTGDGVLEFLYSFSYVNEQCVDGCAILSFQKDSMEELYSKVEHNNCQNIDWGLYKNTSDLPFINYELSLSAEDAEPYILEKRFIKKYHGGSSQERVIEQASIDSSFIQLYYHRGSRQFIQPLKTACSPTAFTDKKIDIRHPAVRLASQHINKNSTNYFQIKGVYRAHLSSKNQVDYLFYTNSFEGNPEGVLKRKVIKITCDGKKWRITGVLYVADNFSAKHLQDVNGDGIDEIIDEQVQTEENGCTKTYRILSFKNRVGRLIYAHKNRYTFCDNAPLTPNKKETAPIGIEYSIRFEDVDNDGIKELLQSSSQGELTFIYNALQDRYLPQP